MANSFQTARGNCINSIGFFRETQEGLLLRGARPIEVERKQRMQSDRFCCSVQKGGGCFTKPKNGRNYIKIRSFPGSASIEKERIFLRFCAFHQTSQTGKTLFRYQQVAFIRFLLNALKSFGFQQFFNY